MVPSLSSLWLIPSLISLDRFLESLVSKVAVSIFYDSVVFIERCEVKGV